MLILVGGVQTPSCAASPNPWGQNLRPNFVSLGGFQTPPTKMSYTTPIISQNMRFNQRRFLWTVPLRQSIWNNFIFISGLSQNQEMSSTEGSASQNQNQWMNWENNCECTGLTNNSDDNQNIKRSSQTCCDVQSLIPLDFRSIAHGIEFGRFPASLSRISPFSI